MRLRRLLQDVEVLHLPGQSDGVEISSVTHDSRAVTPGSLFCCLRGRVVDGHDMAPHAAARGAAALLCSRSLTVELPQVLVADTRVALGPVAANFYDRPSRELTVVGITGTNGKTTTTHLVKAALEGAGMPTGVIGTLSGARTTPEAPELQRQFREMVTGGMVAAAIEVSSHALAQHRVGGTWFAVAAFTNLSPEHLDYHKSMDNYFEAKAQLFTPGRAALAVINTDDPWGRRLLESVDVPAFAYSMSDAEDLELGATRSRFLWRGKRVDLPLAGEFNVLNALCAATIGEALGADAGDVSAGLSAAPSVPGRFELVDAGQPFLVVVDYAHTPASLEQVLRAARRAASGRVMAVFGCGGDRDTAKRPAMGAVATELADLAVLTSDNPRREDPDAIIDAVRSGAKRREVLVVEPDRRAAIGLAIGAAAPGDIVVIAGKGHETVQLVGDRAIPFDDREVAREMLAARAW